MQLDEIKQELIRLTNIRRAGVDNGLMSHLRQMTPNAPPRLTYEELDEQVHTLEEKIGEGWCVVYVQETYGLFPS